MARNRPQPEALNVSNCCSFHPAPRDCAITSSGTISLVSAIMVRAVSISPRVIQMGASNFLASQPARPIWSGCKWVQMIRLICRSDKPSANSAFQPSEHRRKHRPVSTTARSSPSSSSQLLIWPSEPGIGIRAQWIPGAIAMVLPGAGAASPQG